VFTSVRPRLFGIAYRMLSSATEAEDLVQEVWLRWQAYDRAAVADPAAFLATTTTRLAINALQSARARRETYVGPWLPERRAPVTAAAQRELLTRFIAAARSGDMDALEQLFAADVVSLSDGNGRTGIARRPLVGALRVTKYLEAISWFWDGVDVRWVSTNGQTSALLRHDGVMAGMLTASARADGIDQLLWMFNPDKITARSVPAHPAPPARFAEVTKASRGHATAGDHDTAPGPRGS
jgi:hypothetical protein